MTRILAAIGPVSEREQYDFSPSIDCKVYEFERSPLQASKGHERIFHEFLSSKAAELSSAEAILISCKCQWQEAIVIIMHILLTPEWQLGGKKLIWESEESYEEIFRDATDARSGFSKMILLGYYIYFIDVHSFSKNNPKDQHISQLVLSNRKNTEFTLEDLWIEAPTGSHQITNEWGVYKLAHIAGLESLLPSLKDKLPSYNTIYFKYLRRKHQFDKALSTKGPVKHINREVILKRVLLIDDNHDKGWGTIFQEILRQLDPALELNTYTSFPRMENDLDAAIEELISDIKTEQYELILLDLRLVRRDNAEELRNTNIQNFAGGKILAEIKRKFPYLPVIMTTASNKAWNMQQLIDLGADGYFIKDDPENDPSYDLSLSRYNAFCLLIKECLSKHDTLYPFWEFIEKLEKEGTLIEEMVVESKKTKVEQRIIERLKMFFGLLKRTFEDTTFNTERFHYSNMKLAFMTLWSCLNDIQYAYYDKSEIAWVTGTGRVKSNIKINEYLLSGGLGLLNSNEMDFYLQKADSSGKKKFLSRLTCNHDTESFELVHKPIDTKSDYSRLIGEQIAFLILTFARGKSPGLPSRGTSSATLADRLYSLKDKRNKLYLTHGDEESAGDFFCNVEQDNKNISLDDCFQLFEIVYFLLTGRYEPIENEL